MSGFLLASDFDGTLCRWINGGITKEDKDAVQRFRSAGNRFALVTGRDYESTIEVLQEQDFWDMDICFCMSGALCMDISGNIIYDHRTKEGHVGEILQYFKETGALYIAISIGKKNYNVDIGGMKLAMETISFEQGCALPSVTSYNVKYNTEEEALCRAQELACLYGDIVNPLLNNTNVDVPSAGVDKAVAVEYAARIFDIPVKNVYAVGDNLNDLAMVEKFHGRAIAHGPAALRAAAEKTVGTICEIIEEITGI